MPLMIGYIGFRFQNILKFLKLSSIHLLSSNTLEMITIFNICKFSILTSMQNIFGECIRNCINSRPWLTNNLEFMWMSEWMNEIWRIYKTSKINYLDWLINCTFWVVTVEILWKLYFVSNILEYFEWSKIFFMKMPKTVLLYSSSYFAR